MMSTKMTNEFDEKSHTVRMLELEIHEIELGDRLTQLRKSSYVLCSELMQHKIKILEAAIKCREDELSACREDYTVLMDVVDVIKNWDERSGRAFPSLTKITDLLVDYINVPDPRIQEEDSSIDEDRCVTVKVGFLEL